jgi:hypothetical protein
LLEDLEVLSERQSLGDDGDGENAEHHDERNRERLSHRPILQSCGAYGVWRMPRQLRALAARSRQSVRALLESVSPDTRRSKTVMTAGLST